MSLKSLGEHIKQTFSVDAKMEKYVDVLRPLVKSSFEINGSALKGTLPHIYISAVHDSDLKTIKEIYAKFGIKLQQRMMKSGNIHMWVLCIQKTDFEKLSDKQQNFFKRTTNADNVSRKTQLRYENITTIA